MAMGTVLAGVIVAFTFIRPYYRYGVKSIYEFLDIGFGPLTKNLASALFLFTRVLMIGARIYLGGVIIKVIRQFLFPNSPIDLWVYFWGILFVTVLTTIYTTVSGIKAVVWTDMIQACLMVSSVALAIWLIVRHIPGRLATVSQELGGIPPFFQVGFHPGDGFCSPVKSFLQEPYTIASPLLPSTFLTISTHH